MLGTSTYAWFTMSREVEVKGIKMTATVPEDLQIALGAIGSNSTTKVTEANSTTYSLAINSGVLVEGTTGSTASDGKVMAPTTNAWDWSNAVDISAYYDIGRLIPASSNSGHDIFFTPDASGVGKTVKETANYYQATSTTDNLVAAADGNAGVDGVANQTYKATLHALTGTRGTTAGTGVDTWAAGGTGNYTQASAYNKTNDDGYYVDIPIWIRSSSNAAVNLSVDGYIIPGTTTFEDTSAKKKQTELELYRAVRVALLDGEAVDASATGAVGAVACAKGDTAVSVASGNQKNIIPLKDAWVKEAGTTLVQATPANTDATDYTSANILASYTPFAATNPSIVDTKNIARTGLTMATTGYQKADAADGSKLYGVSALTTGTLTGSPDFAMATYSEFSTLAPTSATTPDNVATIEGSGTGKDYGTAKKLIIRVWLDGEDAECWNDNAGQDWAISLKFQKIES
jgi:hypothetical protein